jgi:hypothetical protein
MKMQQAYSIYIFYTIVSTTSPTYLRPSTRTRLGGTRRIIGKNRGAGRRAALFTRTFDQLLVRCVRGRSCVVPRITDANPSIIKQNN